MSSSKDRATRPEISVVVPLYNAACFIEAGIRSIRSQTFTDWELVAINDGSTDNTEELLKDLTKDMQQPLVYHKQSNAGGFAARNTGLDLANSKYIALFDIDDEWFSHHLEHLYSILQAHPEIDWVYAANQIKDLTNDTIVAKSSLYENGKPKPVLELKTKKIDDVSIITDENAIACQVQQGLWVGQQFSLIRREVFEDYRFRASYRNEAADQVSVVAALNRGFTLGYTEDIHGVYHIHTNNASAGCKDAPVEKYLRLRTALIRGFEEAKQEENLTGKNAAAIHKRIAGEYFWNIGYSLFWKRGRNPAAFEYFRKGLKNDPGNLSMWKTYIWAMIQRLAPSRANSGVES